MGTTAIKMVTKIRPHLLLIGAQVPLIQAYNILNFLNTSAELTRIPVLMLSPENIFSSNESVKKLRTPGAEYFTTKIDIKNLVYKINEIIDNQ